MQQRDAVQSFKEISSAKNYYYVTLNLIPV